MCCTWHYCEISNSHSLRIPTDLFFSHLDCGILKNLSFYSCSLSVFLFLAVVICETERRCRKVWELWPKLHAFWMKGCLLSAAERLEHRAQGWWVLHTNTHINTLNIWTHSHLCFSRLVWHLILFVKRDPGYWITLFLLSAGKAEEIMPH